MNRKSYNSTDTHRFLNPFQVEWLESSRSFPLLAITSGSSWPFYSQQSKLNISVNIASNHFDASTVQWLNSLNACTVKSLVLMSLITLHARQQEMAWQQIVFFSFQSYLTSLLSLRSFAILHYLNWSLFTLALSFLIVGFINPEPLIVSSPFRDWPPVWTWNNPFNVFSIEFPTVQFPMSSIPLWIPLEWLLDHTRMPLHV